MSMLKQKKRKNRRPIFRLTRAGALEPTFCGNNSNCATATDAFQSTTRSWNQEEEEELYRAELDEELVRKLGEFATPLPQIEPTVCGVMGNNLYPLAFIRVVQAQAIVFRFEDLKMKRRHSRRSPFSTSYLSDLSSTTLSSRSYSTNDTTSNHAQNHLITYYNNNTS